MYGYNLFDCYHNEYCFLVCKTEAELKTTGGCSDGNYLCGYDLPWALLATGMSNVHTTEEYSKENDLFGTAKWMYEIIKLAAEK